MANDGFQHKINDYFRSNPLSSVACNAVAAYVHSLYEQPRTGLCFVVPLIQMYAAKFLLVSYYQNYAWYYFHISRCCSQVIP